VSRTYTDILAFITADNKHVPWSAVLDLLAPPRSLGRVRGPAPQATTVHEGWAKRSLSTIPK
jgi:hypothetical protein